MRAFLLIVSVCLLSLKLGFTQNVQPLGLALENFDYPFPVNYLSLTIQGQSLKMAYMDVKPDKANGQAVLLLHGKNFCGAYWEQTIKDLTQNGFRVIVPDQIGFGKSTKPNSLQYSFQLLASNTKKLLDTLQIKQVHVLGHSMGGMLATRFALMFPENTQKLILENPIGLEDWKVTIPYQPVEKWYQQELKANAESIRNYQQQSYYHNTWKPEYDKWVDLQYRWTLSPEYPRLAWNSALTYDMIFTQPVVYEFPNIKVPTLLIIGQLDRTALGKNLVNEELRKTLGNYPELGKRTAKQIPNAKLVELDGIGHIPHIEAYPKFISSLLSFLK